MLPQRHPAQITGTANKMYLQEEFPESSCSSHPTTEPRILQDCAGWPVFPLCSHLRPRLSSGSQELRAVRDCRPGPFTQPGF